MRSLRPVSQGRFVGALGGLTALLALAPAVAAESGAGAPAAAQATAVLPASVAAPSASDAHDGSAQAPRSAERSGWTLLRAEPPELVEALLAEKLALLDGPNGPHHHGGGMTHAYVVFARPADEAFALLAQTSRQREYRDELDRLQTVVQLPDGSVDEHAIRMLFVELVYRLRYRVDPQARRITWQLDESYRNPMRGLDGFWEIYALGPERSLGYFGTRVDVGDALPAWLEEAVTRKNLPHTLESCRAWVDAGGAAP